MLLTCLYLQGYRDDTYLVTQGPLKNTINDFWQMIWEFNSRAIVLLCKVMEEGEEKCYLYWPPQTGEEAKFGMLTVTLQSKEQCHDYVVRKLHVCKKMVQWCVHSSVVALPLIAVVASWLHCLV